MKKYSKIMTFGFVGFIWAFFILGFVTKDKAFSEMENRSLAQKPKFTFEKLFNGKFTSEYETYVTDQFFLRDYWVGAEYLSEKALLKTENNGVYFGKDGYFMTKFKEPEEKRLDGNIEHVKALSESLDIPFYFSLIPTSAHTLKDKLPEFSYPYDQDKILQKAQDIKGYFDLSNTLLEHKNEYIYYKTDHHWTSKGAYYAYVKICEAMGIVPSEEPEILEEHKDFFGTLFSNSGARFVDGDTVTLYNTKKLLVKDATGEEIPLYDLSFGDKKDKYSIFLGGNAPLITIENTENQDAPTILLIKDSYSNSLVPLLSNNFSKIYVWDLRFNKTSIKEYIKSENIDNVLVLYSTENFSTDSNLFFLER